MIIANLCGTCMMCQVLPLKLFTIIIWCLLSPDSLQRRLDSSGNYLNQAIWEIREFVTFQAFRLLVTSNRVSSSCSVVTDKHTHSPSFPFLNSIRALCPKHPSTSKITVPFTFFTFYGDPFSPTSISSANSLSSKSVVEVISRKSSSK